MTTPERYSIVEYPGGTNQVAFEFDFDGEYISADHIQVTAIDAQRVEAAVGFVLSGPYTVTIAEPVPAGSALRIRRLTPKGDPLVNYELGSIVSEINLDLSNRQAINVAAETWDETQLLASRLDTIVEELPSTYLKGDKGDTGPKGDKGDISKVATRYDLAGTVPTAELTAWLAERQYAGTFMFVVPNALELTSFMAAVAADTKQGLYIAPRAVTGLATDGSQGAWVRQGLAYLDPLWFGLTVNDSTAGTANSDAVDATMAMVPYVGSRVIAFPAADIWLARTIDITNNMLMRGDFGGGLGAPPGNLRFPTGVAGIRVQGSLTSGTTTKDTITHSSGQGTTLLNLSLIGGFAGVEAEVHGIQLRTKANVLFCTVTDFEGDGIYLGASLLSPTAMAPYGNINASRVDRPTVQRCRKGIFVDGSDANAMTIVEANLSSNRQWAIWDSSFLGNYYSGGQIDTNGTTAPNDGVSIGASMVSDGTNRYFVIAGQEAGASVNAPTPGTNNAYWAFSKAGGTATGFPLWTSGMLVRAGGSVFADQDAAANTFAGVHAEENQGKAQIWQGNLVLGGGLAKLVYQDTSSSIKGATVIKGGTSGALEIAPSLTVIAGSVTAKMGRGLGNASNIWMEGAHPTVAPSNYQFLFNVSQNALIFTYNSSVAATVYPFLISGPSTADVFGSGVAQPHTMFVPRLALSDNANSKTNARRIWIDTAAPTTGAHGQGEWSFHRGTGYQIGNKCTTLGTPGTWTAIYGVKVGLAGADKAAAPSATYAAATGGSTIDIEGRAALVKLAADHADLVAKLRTAGIIT